MNRGLVSKSALERQYFDQPQSWFYCRKKLQDI